jgi:hypothetical protein
MKSNTAAAVTNKTRWLAWREDKDMPPHVPAIKIRSVEAYS